MCVESLNNVRNSHPELVIPIARKQFVWPGFISRKRAFKKENAETMEKIQLGDDFVLSAVQRRHPHSPSAQRGVMYAMEGQG